MNVWLDDERDPPDGTWTVAKTATAAIELLKTGKVVLISLDHDLGIGYGMTGYDVAKFIEQEVAADRLKMPLCMIHTKNPVGRKNIAMALRKAKEIEIKRKRATGT